MTKHEIAAANDEFRKALPPRQVVITCGVAALPLDQQLTLLKMVASHTHFPKGNDPYGEHDFAALDFLGQRFFWKIDYYDTELKYGADPYTEPVKRILTVMLATDY